MELRLYKLTWENPWLAEEMVAVEFSSADANAAPFLVALTVDDAPVDPERERISGGLTQLLQEAASGFAELHPGAGSSEWTRLRLNLEPVGIGGRFYDGFRFTITVLAPCIEPGASRVGAWGCRGGDWRFVVILNIPYSVSSSPDRLRA